MKILNLAARDDTYITASIVLKVVLAVHHFLLKTCGISNTLLFPILFLFSLYLPCCEVEQPDNPSFLWRLIFC